MNTLGISLSFCRSIGPIRFFRDGRLAHESRILCAQKKSFIKSRDIFLRIFRIREGDSCFYTKAEGDERRITMEWGNLKLKGDPKGITSYLTFFKNLTFPCSLDKF